MTASVFRIDACPACVEFIIAARPVAVLLTIALTNDGFSAALPLLRPRPTAPLAAAIQPPQPAAAMQFERNTRPQAVVIGRLLDGALADPHEPNP